ncbi:hypothetical protein V6N13_010761 [Hibiscus sabdariffa]
MLFHGRHCLQLPKVMFASSGRWWSITVSNGLRIVSPWKRTMSKNEEDVDEGQISFSVRTYVIFSAATLPSSIETEIGQRLQSCQGMASS